MTITQTTAQYYAFTLPEDELVWVEAFDDLGHWTAPTPHTTLQDAMARLVEMHPAAMVDELVYAEEVRAARMMARQRVVCSGQLTGDPCHARHICA